MVKYNFVNLLPFVQGTKQRFFFKKKTFGKRSALCSLTLISRFARALIVDVSNNFQPKKDIFRWLPKAVFFPSNPIRVLAND